MKNVRDRRQPGGIKRWPYALLAYFFVGVGLVGVVVPGLPTVIFLILGAWAASRGSQRLHDWLYDHPRYGPALAQWRDHRAISARGKRSAVALMALSWIIMWWRIGDARILFALALLFATISGYLLSRPTPVQEPTNTNPD